MKQAVHSYTMTSFKEYQNMEQANKLSEFLADLKAKGRELSVVIDTESYQEKTNEIFVFSKLNKNDFTELKNIPLKRWKVFSEKYPELSNNLKELFDDSDESAYKRAAFSADVATQIFYFLKSSGVTDPITQQLFLSKQGELIHETKKLLEDGHTVVLPLSLYKGVAHSIACYTENGLKLDKQRAEKYKGKLVTYNRLKANRVPVKPGKAGVTLSP